MQSPWRAVRAVVIGVLALLVIATAIAATVGVHWTSCSGGGRIRLCARHEMHSTLVVVVILLAIEIRGLALVCRWDRARRS